MRLAVFVATALLMSAAPTLAGAQGCAAPDNAISADFAMPKLAAAVQKKRLKVVVVGTYSSMPPGSSGAQAGYPARLEAALRSRFPGVEVHVVSYAKPRQTAAEIAADLGRIIDEKPDLVVWQSGTVDALRGIDPEAYRVTLVSGTEILRAAGADVVLMNMQYSPRTELMLAPGAYVDAMRWVALQHEVPLFDRFAVMRYWNEQGTFDLHSPTKRSELAERVHKCIGELLAEFINNSLKITDLSSSKVNQ